MGTGNTSIEFSGIPLGSQVRKQISKTTIFRVRNGVQEKYDWFSPTNPQTETQQAHRARLTEAVGKWQTLTESEKNQWRDFIKAI